MEGSRLKKGVCLITGASSSMAERLITHLAGDYKIYAGYSKKTAKSVYGEIPVVLDVTSDHSVKKVVTKIIHEYRRIDLLINLAGISPSGSLESFSTSDFQKTLEINTIGPFRLIQAVLPFMKKQKSGQIINIASLSAIAAFPKFSIYSASKFALRGLSLSLTQELRDQNIFVTCVCPGAIQKGIDIPKDSARGRLPILQLLFPLTTIDLFVHKVLGVINSKTPPPEISIGMDTKVSSALSRHFPELWYKIQQFVWQKQSR